MNLKMKTSLKKMFVLYKRMRCLILPFMIQDLRNMFYIYKKNICCCRQKYVSFVFEQNAIIATVNDIHSKKHYWYSYL